MSKTRIVAYDAIKTIAIVLVVLVHYCQSANMVKNTPFANAIVVLYCVAVPLFFMVNGALLLNRPLDVKRHYEKTFKSVAILVAWRAITILIMAVIKNITIQDLDFITFVNHLLGVDYPGFPVGYFWYLYALIGLYIVFPLLKFCFDSHERAPRLALKVLVLFLFVMTFGVTLLSELLRYSSHFFGFNPVSVKSLDLLNPFDAWSFSIMYFLVGGYLARSNYGLEIGKKRFERHQMMRIAFALFLIAWAMLFANQRLQVAKTGAMFFVEDSYTSAFTGIMAFSLFVLFCNVRWWKEKEWAGKAFRIVGDNTLGIYLTHMFFILGIYLYVAPTVGTLRLGLNILIMLGVVLLCLCVSLICRKIPGVRILFRL